MLKLMMHGRKTIMNAEYAWTEARPNILIHSRPSPARKACPFALQTPLMNIIHVAYVREDLECAPDLINHQLNNQHP